MHGCECVVQRRSKGHSKGKRAYKDDCGLCNTAVYYMLDVGLCIIDGTIL